MSTISMHRTRAFVNAVKPGRDIPNLGLSNLGEKRILSVSPTAVHPLKNIPLVTLLALAAGITHLALGT